MPKKEQVHLITLYESKVPGGLFYKQPHPSPAPTLQLTGSSKFLLLHKQFAKH